MEDLSLFLFLLGAEDVGQYFESASVPTDAVVANRTMLAPHLYDDTPPPKKSRVIQLMASLTSKCLWRTSRTTL